MPFEFNNDFENEFPIEQQRMSNWCWAACTVSLCTFYERIRPFSQQQLVAMILNMPICASIRPFPACNKTFDFGRALSNAGHLSGNPIESPLSPGDLAVPLRRGRPVGCQMEIPQIGGHVVIAISGRTDTFGDLVLRVADPSDGSILSLTFSALRNNFRGLGGRWVRSYLTKPLNQI